MEETQLTSLIRRKYDILHDAGVIAISPADLAIDVFNDIDPKKTSPMLVQMAAVLELRQLARGVCRQRHIDSERDAEQGNLFDFQLQPRYSRIANGRRRKRGGLCVERAFDLLRTHAEYCASSP